ncbi:MAG: hypothetical protein CUN55_12295, partial [Phototrophicales bacterium]
GTWNGLMLENPAPNHQIDRVYLAVYPSQDVLDKIIAKEVERGATGALLFTYHPIPYSESQGEFKAIPTEQLEELQEHHISVYVCHAPLDCHPEIGTTVVLANALNIEDQGMFGAYYGGLACVHGQLTNTTFSELAIRLADICELPRLRYDQCRHNGQIVKHVAIAPGSGSLDFMREAAELGVDTFITGNWWLFGDSEFAKASRERIAEFLPTLKMNLLGTSRYSIGFVTMRDYVPDVFRPYNLETVLIRDEEPLK